jgi:predicted metalloenzyme YecM
MKKALNDIITDPIVFLDKLFMMIDESGLNVDAYFLDHICYRVGTTAEYETKKLELLEHGKLLVESMVNGRMISTFKFYEPIKYKNRFIDVIELPAPKPGKSYESGLEHVEFVATHPLKNFVEKYPKLDFEVFGIDKAINADITLKLGDYCIRFHNQTLEAVIQEELRVEKKHV